MFEDLEGLSDAIKASDYKKDCLSMDEVNYVNECVEGGNPSALIDRIDELSSACPPKAIDSTQELADLIEPIKEQIDSKYLEAPSDIEQVEEISDYLCSIENLEYEQWSELTPAQRLETLQEAENKIAEIEHRNPCEIHIKELKPNEHGYFNPVDKSITLSISDISGSDYYSYKETLDTLIHEGRHAYQDYNLTARQVHPRGGEISNWKWNEQELGYQSALFCGFEAYKMQPVESDARAFAEDVLTKYLNKTA